MKVQNMEIPTRAEFVAAYMAFCDSIMDNARMLGGMLERMMQRNSATIDELVAAGFSRTTLDRLYAIGLGRLDARLLLDDSPAAAVVRLLPMPQQQKLLAEGIPVVVDITDAGKVVQKNKPVMMVSARELKRIFTKDGHLQSTEDQAQMMRAEKRQIKVLPAQRYKIATDGETIEVMDKSEFTLSDWMEIGERAAAVQKKFLEANMKGNQTKRRI